MSEPSFGGVYLFGPGPTFHHDEPENAAQMTHYPSVNGVFRLDLGTRESYTQVRGTLVGSTIDDLRQVLHDTRNVKKNATTATLIDPDGEGWAGALLLTFRTHGRTLFAPGWGWCKDYEMTFLHPGP